MPEFLVKYCLGCNKRFNTPHYLARIKFCSRICCYQNKYRTTDDNLYQINTVTGCWEFLKVLDKDGYGVYNLRAINGKARQVRAHRYFYEKYKQSIPSELVLDHLCRNKCCVNPDHLEPVTLQENIHRGFSCKLTKRDVIDIRLLMAMACLKQADIAKIYQLDQGEISRINTGQRWKEV